MSKLSTDEVRPNVVGDALRRHVLLIVGCALVLGLLVAYAAQSRSESYTASAKVLIRPILGNPFSPDTGSSGQQVTIAMETESQVADSAPVAALANKKLATPWVPGTSVVSATVPPSTQVVKISYSAPTSEAAKAGADIVAKSYLDYRRDQTAATQKTRLEILTKQADAVRKSLASASKAAAAANAPAEASQQVQLFANQLVTIQNSISTLESTGADPGSVIAPAALPNGTGGVSPLLLGIGGALVGLAGGVILAIWRERRDKRLRDTDTAVGQVQVLAHMASTPSTAQTFGGKMRGLLGGGAPATVADGSRALYQRVRTVVLANSPAPASITVSGVSSEAPASAVAINLARSLRRSGYRVVLVDADASSAMGAELAIGATAGLGDVLTTSDSPVDLLVEVDGVQVLPAGESLADHEALLFSERFGAVLRELQSIADYVVVTAPPAATPAGMGIGVTSDVALLVGMDGRTTAQEVEAIAARADQLRVRILGLVAMPRPRRGLARSRAVDEVALPAVEGPAEASAGEPLVEADPVDETTVETQRNEEPSASREELPRSAGLAR